MPLPEFAHEWMNQWKRAAVRLAELRRENLKQLTEAEAARMFEMLEPPWPFKLRPTSGLVQQQNRFCRLRQLRDTETP